MLSVPSVNGKRISRAAVSVCSHIANKKFLGHDFPELLQKLKSSRREMPIPLSKVEPMYSREATLVAFESGTYPKPDSQLHGLDNVVTPIEFCLPDSPIHIHTYAAMFCTKNEMHYGMSVGDVGAPLVRNGTLIGIASWLARSGNNFDVYMNVHRYEDFIKKATKCMDRFCILV